MTNVDPSRAIVLERRFIAPDLPSSENRNLEDGSSETFAERPDDVDALIVRELNQMSLEERGRTYEELHGVNEMIDETPEFVKGRLNAMHGALQNIPRKNAFDQAMAQSPDYVLAPKLRIAFLRAESFDAQKAAERMVKFMEGKLKYFGRETLTRPVRLSDLSADDMSSLKSGHLQFLPVRDRGDRMVLCDLQAMESCGYKEAKNMVRAILYLLLSAMEDEYNQKKGIVLVIYQINSPPGIRNPTPEMAREGPLVLEWVPIKVAGAHLCFDDPVMKALGRVLLSGAGRAFRARYRLHDGTHTEVLYKLMSFGIPIDCFPISSEGALKKAVQNKWLAKRKVKEDSLKECGAFHGIDTPVSKDVLVGKGKPIQMHSGNINLRSLVADHWFEYSVMKKGKKSTVIKKVLKIVQGSSGRFLVKAKNDWWVEVSQMDAVDKVTRIFLSMGTKVNRGMALVAPCPPFALRTLQPKKKQRTVSSSESSCFGFI